MKGSWDIVARTPKPKMRTPDTFPKFDLAINFSREVIDREFELLLAFYHVLTMVDRMLDPV